MIPRLPDASRSADPLRAALPGRISRKPGRLAAVGLALLLAGCAMPKAEVSQNYETDRASRLFAAGFQDVSDIYIDTIPVSDLALAGIENLAALDPAVRIERRGQSLAVTVDGQETDNVTLPSRNDADSWADVTAATINATRARSVQFAKAGAEDVYEAVFDGIVGQLDTFSRYAGREEARENRASRDGFGGIGVRINLVDEGVKVLSVMEETPAEAAGLKDGDTIVMIDGQPVTGLSQREVVRRLRGPLNSEVTLTVDREGVAQRQVVVVTRAHIVPQTVKYEPEVDGRVGYVRISGFNQSTAQTLRQKIETATKQLGPNLVGLILDLRSNPGGLLDQSVSVSDLFLRSGRIVSTHGRHPDSHQYFEASNPILAEGVPIVVLINGSSASASEIVAAALQDARRAVVVGSSSFGKGTVQTVLRLPNEGELTLTWARFHAPSGYALNHRGVLPDICTSNASSAQEIVGQLASGRHLIDRASQTLELAPDDEAGVQRLRALCPSHEGDNEIDLEVARALLRNPALYATALKNAPVASTGSSVQQGSVAASSPL